MQPLFGFYALVIGITIIETIVIRCLSFHAAYRCRHAGACCRAGWNISFDEAEADRVHTLSLNQGSIVHGTDGGKIAARSDSGTCGFFDSDGLCTIQRVGGLQALPVACRIFPRSILIDGRGTFVSLSHFCPTAAALLFQDAPPAAIVNAPASLVDVGALDGLDAREAWPPLLRPGVLMDLESYDVWERLGVELLTRDGIAPDTALAWLEDTALQIASWTPADGLLIDRVREAFGVIAPPTAVLAPCDVAVKRWLAARFFGNWIAYQRDGLAAIAGYLRSCFATLAAELARNDNALEAIRRSDLRIMHT